MGNCLRDLKKYPEAAEKYQRVTEIDPDNAKAWKYWGIALKKLNKHDEAAEKIKKAAELESKDI